MALMRLFLLAVMPVAILCAKSSYTGSDDANVVPLRDAMRIIAGSNLNFTNALYQVVSQREGNVFFSPLSIQVVMALAAQGAGGKTLQEMVSGLRIPQDQHITRNGFRQLLTALKNNDGEYVKIANKIYTDRRYPPTEEFARIAQDYFHSDGEKVDFNRNYDQARRTINQWVEANTMNKIRNLLAEGSISRDTVMVLVNAIYFKGTWLVQFKDENTKSAPFYVRQGAAPTSVQMMHVTEGEKFYYKEAPELKARILSLPYVGESMNFVIVLPNERFGLREVESRLATADLTQLFRGLRTPEIHLKMPKFKLEQFIDLNNALNQMGMSHMFSNTANFSALATGPVKISKVVHKAFIEVNEEGSEAAGATAIHSVLLSAVPDEPESVSFVVDHPFIFYLLHERTGSILFMGRYTKPA